MNLNAQGIGPASRWTSLAICCQQLKHSTFPDSFCQDSRGAPGCPQRINKGRELSAGHFLFSSHAHMQDWKVGRDRFSGPTYHILVEKVEDHVGKSCITPVPVDKKELAEMSELRHGEVTGHHRLQRQRNESTTLSDQTCQRWQRGDLTITRHRFVKYVV